MNKHILIKAENDSLGDASSWISELYIDESLERQTEFATLDMALRDASTFKTHGNKVKLTIDLDESTRLEPASSD